MLLSNRLVPRLPTTLTGADDDVRRRFRTRLSRRSRWVIAAAVISLLLHLLALFIILREKPHAPLNDSQATSPVEWQVETELNKTSSAPASASTPAPPPSPVPQQSSPQPTPKPQVEPQPEKPVERQEDAKPTPPQPETPPTPPRPTAPPTSSVPDGVLFRPEQPPQPAPAPPPPPPKPAKQVTKPQPEKPVIPLSPLVTNSPFAQRPTPKQPPSNRPPAQENQNHNAMDLSIGPVERFAQDAPRRNESDMSSDVQVEGAQLGSDWLRQLHEWWIEHRRYPDEAVRDRQSGTVIIRIDVDRRGYTSNPEILQHSGSRWLDLQTLATFGHTKLPSFPINTPEDNATLTLIVRYEIY